MPLLTLFTGAAGKIAGVAALMIGLLAAAAVALNQHDARVRAEMAAAAQAVQIATMRADNSRTVAALEASAAAAESRANHLAAIRSTVDVAPRSSACNESAAVRAAVDGLRRQPAERR